MLTNSVWVLTRPHMTWHVLAQHCRDPRGLFGRESLCGTPTPLGLLDVLSFTQAEPPHLACTNLCIACGVALTQTWRAYRKAA